MLHDVIMPKSGIYEDDVELIRWLVAEGEEVSKGDPVLEMATDKVEVEVEAEESGYIHHLMEATVRVAIGTKVGVIATTRAEYDELVR